MNFLLFSILQTSKDNLVLLLLCTCFHHHYYCYLFTDLNTWERSRHNFKIRQKRETATLVNIASTSSGLYTLQSVFPLFDRFLPSTQTQNVTCSTEVRQSWTDVLCVLLPTFFVLSVFSPVVIGNGCSVTLPCLL